jgi:hypothetical protein
MRHFFLGSLVVCSIAAGFAAACGDSGTSDGLQGAGNGTLGQDGGGGGDATTATDAGGTTNPGDDGGDNTGINTTGMGAGSGAVTGLPCDIQQLLENRCIGCHLGPSPKPLLTYTDLTAKSSVDPTKTMAQESLVRMQSTTSPMPPAPAVPPTAAEIMTFQAWVTAGTPMGAVCTSLPDGGAPDGGDAGTTTTNFNTPTVCTSMKTWNGGNQGSSQMHPGDACITCHTMRGGPAYTVAGTVYPTAHEPNDCNGVAGGYTVVVTDANNAVTNITVNTAGNFDSRAAIVAPFHVKVMNNTSGAVRAMAGSLTAGDCNSCHTVTGANGAPGRIVAP